MPISETPKRTINFKILLPIAVITIMSAGSILMPVMAVQAAPITVNQCNDSVADNIGGRGVTCDITVVNNLDLATGIASSTVTTHNCSGFANTALTCIDLVSTTSDLVLDIQQCNGTTNGGGGVLDCSITVTNNVTGSETPLISTVNQCLGSGEGSGAINTTICDPVQTTVGAPIDQCNGSGNGDGAPDRVLCKVNASTSTNSIPVVIHQCNGSSNGGGAFVTCDVFMATNILAPNPDTGGGVGGGTTPPITTPGGNSSGGEGNGGSTPVGNGSNNDGSNASNGAITNGGANARDLAATGSDETVIANVGISSLIIGLSFLTIFILRRRINISHN